MFVLIYFDDILIMYRTNESSQIIVNALSRHYDIHINKTVNRFFRVQLEWKTRTSDGRFRSLTMSQPFYTRLILGRFQLERFKPVCTPMVDLFWRSLEHNETAIMVDVQLYQQMTGSLLYLGLRTRPDILSAVIILTRFQKAFSSYCNQSVKRILRYLRGTSKVGITFYLTDLNVRGFVDADFAGDCDDRRSMSGNMIKLGSAP